MLNRYDGPQMGVETLVACSRTYRHRHRRVGAAVGLIDKSGLPQVAVFLCIGAALGPAGLGVFNMTTRLSDSCVSSPRLV